MNHMIKVENLRKSYGSIDAVKGISFYVETGKLFAFLGPNGAGKSTTIDMICTFLQPDSGEVIIDNLSLGSQDKEIRNSIGVVFQDGLLDRLLTVEENLCSRAGFYGLKGRENSDAVKTAMEAVGILSLAKRTYGTLSGGQRRRCDIARALINTPKILFLDEPTTGLDPQTRKAVWETIQSLQQRNQMTVFLTTHYMEEAANADFVVIIDDGMIADKGTPSDLCERYARNKLTLYCTDISKVEALLKQTGQDYIKSADRLVLPLQDTLSAVYIIQPYKEYLSDFEVTIGTMDDVFLAITGKEIRE